MLAACWQHAGNMLTTCWQYAGNNKAFFQGPEAFIMETGVPFENYPPLSSVLCPLSSVLCPLSFVLCPLSSVICPLSSVSSYSVLLGARLGAICAQKEYKSLIS